MNAVDFSLNAKIALIAGGSRGIGRRSIRYRSGYQV